VAPLARLVHAEVLAEGWQIWHGLLGLAVPGAYALPPMKHPGAQLPPAQTWPALHDPLCQVPVASHVAGMPPAHLMAPGLHIPVHAPPVHTKGHVICLVNVCPSAQTSTDPVLSHLVALRVHPPPPVPPPPVPVPEPPAPDASNWRAPVELHPKAAQKK
jgi:hypothetical protein